MNGQVALQKILRGRISLLRRKNAAYSLRAFSRRLGITPGTLSLFLLGKRKLSTKLVLRIANRLGLDPQEKSELLESFPKARDQRETTPNPDPDYLQLTADQFNVVADWEYFAILNLIGLPNAKHEAQAIGERLGIAPARARNAIERLLRLGMMKKTETGFERSSPRYRTTDDVTSLSLQRSHHQTLELAQRSLDGDPTDRRDFTWVTFRLDSKKIPEAKTLIRKFQDDFLDLVETDAVPDEVYRLSMQLFPLTLVPKDPR